MTYLQRDRYDYFLIWGNGLQYKDEILEIIRSEESLKILRIMRHTPKTISKLVRTIYSYDYAPLQHLKSKTKYLLKTDPEVIFIFVHNQDVQAVYRGRGQFRHIECMRIKSVKEEIRNRFNPRKNGQRTEEHVVHASDNESQVHHVLKYLGFQNGIRFLKRVPNAILSPPYYLSDFDEFVVRCVHSSQLYCTILRGARSSFQKEIVRIKDTPHFACLTGDTTAYQSYLFEFFGGALTADYSVEKLKRLSQNMAYLKYPYTTSYILVKEFQPDQYLILDGIHRACILEFRGVNELTVAVKK